MGTSKLGRLLSWFFVCEIFGEQARQKAEVAKRGFCFGAEQSHQTLPEHDVR
jgi:hypothetical protein